MSRATSIGAALAAAQRLLQVDADDPAVRGLERRRPAQVGDCRGRRGTGGLDSQSRRAAPGRDRLAQIGQSGAEIRVGKLGARADVKVLPDPFDAGLAVEAAIVGGSFDEARAQATVVDDDGRGRVGEGLAIDVRDGPREGASRRSKAGGCAIANRRALHPPAGSNSRSGSADERLDRRPIGGEGAGNDRPPAGAGDFERAFKGLLRAGQRRLVEHEGFRRGLELRRDRYVVGGESRRRRRVEERGQCGDRRYGRGHVALGARRVPAGEHAIERKLRDRQISAMTKGLGAPFAAASGSLSAPRTAMGAFRQTADRLKRS